MNLLLLLCLWLAWTVTTALGDDSTAYRMSLPDVLSHAQEHAYALQMSKEEATIARANSRAAWQGILPSVSLQSAFMRSDDPVAVFGTKLRQGIFTANDFQLNALNRPPEINGFSTSLIAQVPLFNPGDLFGKLAANHQAESAASRLDWTRSVINFQIRQAYWRLYLSTKRQSALAAALRSAAAICDNARLAIENGLLSRADFLAAELRHAELEEMLIIAGNDLQAAGDALKLLAGFDKPGAIVPLDSIPGDIAIPPSLQNPQHNLHRSDLSALKHQVAASKHALRQARSRWLPRLNGVVSRDWHGDSWLESDNDSWTIGATLELSLFSGFSRVGNTAKAAAHLRKSEAAYRKIQQQSRQGIAALVRHIKAAQQRIQVAELAVEHAHQGLDERRKRHAEGLATLADLLMQESLLIEAELRELQARYDLQVSIDEYELLTGYSDPEQEMNR